MEEKRKGYLMDVSTTKGNIKDTKKALNEVLFFLIQTKVLKYSTFKKFGFLLEDFFIFCRKR